MDINKDLDHNKLAHAIEKNNQIILLYWSIKNKKLSFGTILFLIRYLILLVWVRSGLVTVTHDLNERRIGFKKILSFLRPIKKLFS